MPFDEEDPKEFKPKIGLKKIEGQKSMFDGKPRPPSQQEFQQKVQMAQETISSYNQRAADLFVKFSKMMGDKTLSQNKNILQLETEKEILQNLLQLGQDINNDPNEPEGLGSLTLITVLFKTCVLQKDKINQLEWSTSTLQKQLDANNLSELVKKEIAAQLDKQKNSG